MYTEINQAVNFVARHLHFRIPRLKICLFAEHLANILLLRYNVKWDEKYKDQRVLHFIQGFALSDEIANAALAIGLGVEEIVTCLPERLKIFINPNEVYYIVGDVMNNMPKTIWMSTSAVNDEKYIPGTHVPLFLVQPKELGIENPFPNNPQEFLMFRYIIPGSQNFTVETFAQTRFGSLRKRPDPEVLRRLQKSIIAANSLPATTSLPSSSNSCAILPFIKH